MLIDIYKSWKSVKSRRSFVPDIQVYMCAFMFMRMYVYVCTHPVCMLPWWLVHVHVRILACLYECTLVLLCSHVCMLPVMQLCTYYEYLDVHVCMNVCMDACMYAIFYICIYAPRYVCKPDMSRASASRDGRSGNLNLVGSNPDHVLSQTNDFKVDTCHFPAWHSVLLG